MMRAAMTLLVMMLTTTTAWADSYPEYITDVCVVGGSASDVEDAAAYYENLGYTIIRSDLNKGCGTNSHWIWVGYKKGSRANTYGGYITDIVITNDSSYPETMTFNGITYYRAPCRGNDYFQNGVKGDLNSKAGGADIHLYYTRNNFADKRVVTDISITYGEGSKSGAIKWDGDSNNDPADLNAGAGGDYIYMHQTTTTKTNRPSSDPVMTGGLVYNGSGQQVLTINNSNTGAMMYRVGTSGDFSSSLPAATTAGTHTVYYYAASNEYGDQSATNSQTVTISMSSNSGVSVNVSASTIYGYENIMSKLSLSGINLSSGSVTYLFSESADGTYSSSVPTTPDKTYYVKATIAGDGNCYEYTTACKSFYLREWDGSGTSASPYLISSTADLDRLSTRVNGKNTYKDIYFKLTTNLTYSGTNNFTPIGSEYGCWFNGTFDGAGYTISGINIISSSTRGTGLFIEVGHSGTIKDVVLANATITNDCDDNVGGIVCRLYGTMTDCFATNVTMNCSGARSCGIIGGCKYSSTTLSNNYYYNCTCKGKTTAIGFDRSDVMVNNGAVSVHTLTLGSGVSTTTSAAKTYNGTNYYAQGSTIALSASVADGFAISYDVNGSAISGSSFTMPAQNTTVTATWTENVLELADATDNTTVIADAAASGKIYNRVILANRTLFKDGAWNTLCLPFTVGDPAATDGHHFDGTPLEGADVRELIPGESGLSQDGTTLTLNFTPATGEGAVTKLVAGTPYIIKWASGDDIVNPVFTGVTISSTTPQDYDFTGGKFVGSYSPVDFTANDKSILYLGAENKLFWPNADMTLGACRAYFKLGDTTASEIFLNFDGDEDGEATKITTTDYTDLTDYDGVWYDLQGRKIANGQKPTAKGLYIHGGRKIVVK